MKLPTNPPIGVIKQSNFCEDKKTILLTCVYVYMLYTHKYKNYIYDIHHTYKNKAA